MKRRVVLGTCKFVLGLSLLALLGVRALAGLPTSLPLPNNAQGYGTAVSLSPDGSVAVVAANNPNNNNLDLNTNTIFVFQYADGAWNSAPMIELEDPASGTDMQDQFGAAIAVSAVTNNTFTLAVGSADRAEVHGQPIENGVVFLYTCTLNAPAGCTQVAVIFDPVDAATPSDRFGSAVAVSQDGNTLLVGAWGISGAGGAGVGNMNEAAVGAAYVYIASGGNWPTLPTARLSENASTCASFGSPQSQIVCDKFGYAVALSADGNTALVGAPGVVTSGQPNQGSAFAFQVNGGQWQTLPVTTLAKPDATACTNLAAETCDFYGAAVALSADGSTAAVGAPNALGNGASAGDLGDVSVFHRLTPGTWAGVTSPVLIFTNPNENLPGASFSANQAIQNYGSSLALSSNGSTVLVGSPRAQEGAGYDGAIDLYTCNFSASPNCVNTPAEILNPPLGGSNALFGSALAMSSDATVVLGGAPNTPLVSGSGNGAAFVYGAPGAQAAISLVLSAFPNPVAPGGTLTYEFTATNTANLAIAADLTLTFTLPAGVTYLPINAPAGGTCSFSAKSATLTCTLAALAAGATWQPSVLVTAGSTPTVLHASATVTAGSAIAEAFFTAVIDVPPVANSGQLEIVGGAATSGTLSATPGSIAALTYGIVAQPAHGTVALTNASTGAFTYTPAAGYAGSDSFTFNVSDGLWISSAATEDVVVATSTAALSLSYTGPNGVTVVANQDLVYDLTVTNTDKQQPAINVVLNGTLVAGVTLISDSAAGATCTTTATTYTCMLASLAAGATWTPSVTVQLGPAASSQSVQTAVANVKAENSSNSPSISASVSESQTPTTLGVAYVNLDDLCNGTIFRGACPIVTPGASYSYAVAVSNTEGSPPAKNVLVTVSIPAGMTFSNPSAGAGVCLIDAAEAKMVCALNALDATAGTAGWEINFIATVNSTDVNGQALTSQATATASNTGPTPVATQSIVVGTPIKVGGGGSVGWPELLALCGLVIYARKSTRLNLAVKSRLRFSRAY